MRKQFVVIGAGRFGASIALRLNELGEEVMVIDRSDETIHNLADRVTHAVQADATEESALKALGVRNFDVAVVSIGSDIQSSILITLLLKELGVPFIIAKAQSEHHAKVLYRIGADKVVQPERDMGYRIATSLVSENFLDFMELAPNFGVAEVAVTGKWEGRTLKELDLRGKHGVNVMAIKRLNQVVMSITADTELFKDDVLVVIGKSEILKDLERI